MRAFPDAPRRPSSPAIGVQVETTAQHVGLITVIGPLDATGEAQLMTAARLVMADSYVLLLDLRQLTGCDSAGVLAVLEVDALARAGDGQLVILPADDSVHSAFEESGATRWLQFIGTARASTPPPN